MKAESNTYYIALSIYVDKKNKAHFKKSIQNQLSRTIGGSICDDMIQDVSVYSHNKTVERHGNFKTWNYLLLMQLKSEEYAQQLVPRLRTMAFPFAVETVRMELLVTTPESTYPMPSDTVKKRRVKPFFAIEYVDVQEKYLKEFRDIMISNNGPAMKFILQNAKWCYNIYALETVRVFYHNLGHPVWNQIHIVGLYLESIILYKRDFSKGLEWANKISFKDNFARLKQIRTMLYKTLGGKIV